MATVEQTPTYAYDATMTPEKRAAIRRLIRVLRPLPASWIDDFAAAAERRVGPRPLRLVRPRD